MKCIGKCILKLANQKSRVRRAWATWFWWWRCAVTRRRAWRKLLPIRCIAVQKRAVQFTKKPYLPLFLSETADKFARDFTSVMPHSSYSRFLVSELKYTFPNTFHTPRARVSRNLNMSYYVIFSCFCWSHHIWSPTRLSSSGWPHCLCSFYSSEDETVMHLNQAYETVTRMSHSRPATIVPTEPCPAYGVVGAYHWCVHDTAHEQIFCNIMFRVLGYM